MTNEISKKEWKKFFDDISRNYLEWETRVEIFRDDVGAQILSEGLPLIGFSFDEEANDGLGEIEIMLGEESGIHQTHTIFNPQKVFFREEEENALAAVEFEDDSSGKTLVVLVEPISVLLAYEKAEIFALH